MKYDTYLYRAFGLIIKSEFCFQELGDPINKNSHLLEDVVITVKDLSLTWEEYGISGKFSVQKDQTLFEIKDTAIFCVQDGQKIIVSPYKHADEDKIKLYMLGTCMGILLIQRGTLPLHGSAIAIDGKAYCIVGDSGAGKSTLASEFMRRGYKLLTDDIIPVAIEKTGNCYVIPSYPQQKLWIESLNQIGIDSSNFRPLFDRETKFAVPVNSQFQTEALPLAGIIELVKSDEKTIHLCNIDKLNKLQTLFAHTYRNLILSRSEKLEWHFRTTAHIANLTPLYQLQRPLTRFSTPELAEIILSEISREEQVHA